MPGNRTVFHDQFGRPWHGQVCNSCRLVYTTAYNRALGKVERSQVIAPRNKKGYQSELVAKRYFENEGFKVLGQSSGKGPDLLIDFFGLVLSVEVKSTILRRKGFYVGHVTPRRKNDDLICYVHLNRVYLLTMKEHLSYAYKNGHRVVTHLLKDFIYVG